MPGIASLPIEQWLVRTYRVATIRLWGIRIALIGIIVGAWLLVNALSPADGAEAAALTLVSIWGIPAAAIFLIVVESHAFRARRCGTICVSPAGLWVAALGQRIPWENVVGVTDVLPPRRPWTALRIVLAVYWGVLFLIFAVLGGNSGDCAFGPSGPFLVAVIDRDRALPWLRWMGWLRPLSRQELSALSGIDAEGCEQAGVSCVPLSLILQSIEFDRKEFIDVVNLRARCGKGAKVSPRAL